MIQSNVKLLENAQAVVENAGQARQLARSVPDPGTVGRLLSLAAELDARGREYERLTGALNDTVASIQKVSAELGELMEQVRQTLEWVRGGD